MNQENNKCIAICNNGQKCQLQARYSYEEKRYCNVHYNIIRTKEDSCSICLDLLSIRARTKINCGHMYHVKCITDWVRQDKDTCPVCRSSLDADNLIKFNRDVLDYIGYNIYNLSPRKRKCMLSNITNTMMATNEYFDSINVTINDTINEVSPPSPEPGERLIQSIPVHVSDEVRIVHVYEDRMPRMPPADPRMNPTS